MRKRVISLILVLVFVSAFIVFAQTLDKNLKSKPMYIFKVEGIKAISVTPSKVRFQVQYFISPLYPQVCYIGAYIPNKAHMSGNFAFKPAGWDTGGVPKGQKYFSDNVTFEASYIGTGPSTSSTIEVVIYNSSNNITSSVINWGQTWKRFDIQGIKRIYTAQERVKVQVQYFIDPEYPSPCFIGAYIPNKANQSPNFAYVPAGGATGVPKGQRHFADNVVVDIQYTGATPYTSTTIEMVIYKAGQNLHTQLINWGQLWSLEVR